jgi:ATP-grasp domain-containing protein
MINKRMARSNNQRPGPFFGVDVARRAGGVERIVETGDWQLSDLVGWSVERFVHVWGEVG